MGHRKMPAYGEREHGGRYILDEYEWSRNHCKAVTIRRWKRDLKKFEIFERWQQIIDTVLTQFVSFSDQYLEQFYSFSADS